MFKSDTKCRSSMRGLRKCPRCGLYNGNRAKGCSNNKCPLHCQRKSADKKKNAIDPIQLVCYSEMKIFSVRVKDKDPSQRNFVQIIDTTLAADKDGSIISRNAICFVDTCKYDSTDMNISCKHVKCASECSKLAIELKIIKDVLYSLNITEDLKDSLWALYSDHEKVVPPVQRINKSTFAVKCRASPNLPAGRLHITALSDDENSFNYSCGCKKLRIVLSPNNSVLVQNDTCDHLILLLAGLLSSDGWQKQYQNFINTLSGLWMTTDSMFESNLLQSEDFTSFPENILNSCIEFPPKNLNNDAILENDPNLQRNENIIEDDEIQLVSLPLESIENNNEFETSNLELAECQIELMDQFKLTNQIDLCNDEIHLCEADLFDENHIICNLNEVEQQNFQSCDNVTDITKQTDMIVDTHKQLKTFKPKRPNIQINSAMQQELESPSLAFNTWLSNVIEKINQSIDFDVEHPVISLSFDIKHEFFNYLSKKFSVGDKRRIPNSTHVVAKGKHKGRIKSTWIFTTSSAVRRIFSNEEANIQLEKDFMEKSPGHFIPYKGINREVDCASSKKLKKILPTMYKAFINFGTKSKTTSTVGFCIEWTPNVYPKSQFGILGIEFGLAFKKNNKIYEKYVQQSVQSI